MPEILETQCPHCKKTMKLKSRKALGKQAPCPQCKKPFLVKEVPAEPIADYEADALTEEYDTGDTSVDHDFEYYDEPAGDDYDDAPRRGSVRSKGRSGGKKRRSKKKNAAWVKPTLIIGGSVLGVVILGLGTWLVWGMFSKKLELAWLPPDATSISVERPASMWKSTVGKRYTSEYADKILEKQREMFGVCQTDIASITSASGGGKRGGITVVRSSTNFDPEKILGHAIEYEKIEHNGRDIYRVGGTSRRFRVRADELVLFFPDDRTLVYGSETSVKDAIDRGPEPAEREELAFVDAGYDKVQINLGASASWALLSRSLGKAKPIAMASGIDAGESKVKTVLQAKFETESAAESVYKEAIDKQKDDLEKWESTFRQQLKESLERIDARRKPDEQFQDGELDDALRRSEDGLKSRSISCSGRVITVKSTGYASRYELRMAEKRRGERRVSSIDSIARSFASSTFGFTVATEQTRQMHERNKKIESARKSRVMNYTFVYRSLSGPANQNAPQAFNDAIRTSNGVDASRAVLDEANRTITVYSKPGEFLSLPTVMSALRTKGFQGLRPTRGPSRTN